MVALGSQRQAEWTTPTRRSAALFAAKVAAHRLIRLASDVASGAPRLAKAETDALAVGRVESRTALWRETAGPERAHELGKVENLRVAARSLHGLLLPAGAVFSFWRQVGPPVAARGFVVGRMLREGCLVPAVGGGLCQLSNALYEVALEAGCTILERHAHSRIVEGSAAAAGADATVAWNYVDLRFSTPRPLRLKVRLDAETLIVALEGAAGETPVAGGRTGEVIARAAAPRSCETCDETDCFRHGDAAPARAEARAFLVDESWPEFRACLADERRDGDRLAYPLDGARLRLPRYGWGGAGFATSRAATLAALRRAAAVRAAGAQGARRRRADLAGTEAIARSLARGLGPEVTELVIAQSYLPFLWRDGRLGGRRFSVLMTRLPMAELQARLDKAALARPECATLADFRAPAWLAAAEAEALAAASAVITPHAGIAALFPGRTVRLPWRVPPSSPRAEPAGEPFIAFPGPTVGRKGAYAVHEAAAALGLPVLAMGSDLEGPRFWKGVRLIAGDWRGALAMVQPAVVEDQPRLLLAALASGVPVIASPACGLDPQPGLTLVRPDDGEALARALRALLALR